MSDLIDRQELLKGIEDAQKVIDKIPNGIVNDTATTTLKIVRKIVDVLPAVQPQPEIVRCKDCKHADDDGVCQNSVGLVIQDDDDFCSRAVRRTDGV